MQLSPVRTRAQWIDEYGELKRKKAEAEVRITREVGLDLARLEEVEAEIQSWYSAHPADHPAVDEGMQYFLEVTACEFRREIGIAAKRKVFALLKKKLGADPLGLFGITLEAIKTHLGNPVLEELATKERSGARKLKAVAKAAPAEPVRARARKAA